MVNAAQLIPDVLEHIFAQPTLAQMGSRTLGFETIEDDSEISGEHWTKQIEAMDRHKTRSCHPNYNLYSLLFVCKAWYPIALRHLYRSVAIGVNSRGTSDGCAAGLFHRSLALKPQLAEGVRFLALQSSLNTTYHPEIHPQTYVAIIGLCVKVTTLEFWNYDGDLSGLYTAISGLTLLESLTYALSRLDRHDAHRNFSTFSSDVHMLMPNWPHLRSLYLLSDSVQPQPAAVGYAHPEINMVHNPKMDKLCIYHHLPTACLLKPLISSPILLRVLRLWFPPFALDNIQIISGLLRESLIAWSSSLQRLTLQIKGLTASIEPLRLLGEEDAQTFTNLVELQATRALLPPSCLGSFPKLEFLSYDSDSVEELTTLRRVVSDSKTLRYLSFFSEYPLALVAQHIEHSTEDVDTSSSYAVHVENLRAICARRNICFSNTSLFDDPSTAAHIMPPPPIFWDTSDDEDEAVDEDSISAGSVSIGDDSSIASDSDNEDEAGVESGPDGGGSIEDSEDDDDDIAANEDHVDFEDADDEIEQEVVVEESDEDGKALDSGDDDGHTDSDTGLELGEEDSRISSGSDESIDVEDSAEPRVYSDSSDSDEAVGSDEPDDPLVASDGDDSAVSDDYDDNDDDDYDDDYDDDSYDEED